VVHHPKNEDPTETWLMGKILEGQTRMWLQFAVAERAEDLIVVTARVIH